MAVAGPNDFYALSTFSGTGFMSAGVNTASMVPQGAAAGFHASRKLCRRIGPHRA